MKSGRWSMNRPGLAVMNHLSVMRARHCIVRAWVVGGLLSSGATLWAYDYHLKVNSPCIDAGDPASEYGNEPVPNGGRINLGAYGNTSEATCSYPDPNNDNDNDGMPNWYEIENSFNPDDASDGGGVRQFVVDYVAAHGIGLPPGFNAANYPFTALNGTDDPDSDGLTNLE